MNDIAESHPQSPRAPTGPSAPCKSLVCTLLNSHSLTIALISLTCTPHVYVRSAPQQIRSRAANNASFTIYQAHGWIGSEPGLGNVMSLLRIHVRVAEGMLAWLVVPNISAAWLYIEEKQQDCISEDFNVCATAADKMICWVKYNNLSHFLHIVRLFLAVVPFPLSISRVSSSSSSTALRLAQKWTHSPLSRPLSWSRGLGPRKPICALTNCGGTPS